MMKEIRFAFYAIKKNIQNSAELRASFLMNVFGMAINNSSFLFLWIFFVRSVGVINGWTAVDIVGLLGFGTFCFGIVYSIGAGIRKLPEYTASGACDRFMLSPKNLLLRIATSSLLVSAIGDIVFGFVCLSLYVYFIQANFYQLLMIPWLIIVSTTVFLATAVAIHSMSFLFTDANSVTLGLFELFLSPSLSHGGAFQGALRFVFTFLVPSLVVGALPVEIVRDISFEKLIFITILAIIWFFLSIKIFYACVKKYESSNFMTFGS